MLMNLIMFISVTFIGLNVHYMSKCINYKQQKPRPEVFTAACSNYSGKIESYAIENDFADFEDSYTSKFLTRTGECFEYALNKISCASEQNCLSELDTNEKNKNKTSCEFDYPHQILNRGICEIHRVTLDPNRVNETYDFTFYKEYLSHQNQNLEKCKTHQVDLNLYLDLSNYNADKNNVLADFKIHLDKHCTSLTDALLYVNTNDKHGLVSLYTYTSEDYKNKATDFSNSIINYDISKNISNILVFFENSFIKYTLKTMSLLKHKENSINKNYFQKRINDISNEQNIKLKNVQCYGCGTNRNGKDNIYLQKAIDEYFTIILNGTKYQKYIKNYTNNAYYALTQRIANYIEFTENMSLEQNFSNIDIEAVYLTDSSFEKNNPLW